MIFSAVSENYPEQFYYSLNTREKNNVVTK